MSLRFRYRLARASAPIAALGGRFGRPRPIINVTLVGASAIATRSALLDSGADESIFPELVAQAVGIDLNSSTLESANYVRFGNIPVRRAVSILRISDGIETCEWRGLVAFTPARLIYPILGFAGCLQFFDATFRGALEEVELVQNALYPGV